MNQRKPVSLMIVAVFGVIFGVIGLCLCIPGNVAQVFAPQAAEIGGVTIPPPDYTTNEKILLILSLFLQIPASGLLLAGSIGTFFLAPWARWCSIAYGGLTILATLMYNVGSIRSSTGQSQMLMQGLFPNTPMPTGMESLTMIFGVIFGTICGSIFPVIVLVVYNLPSVRAAFRGETTNQWPPSGPPSGGYAQPPQGWPGYQQPGYQPQGYQAPYPPQPPSGQYGQPAPQGAPPYQGHPPQAPPQNYYPPTTPYPPYPEDDGGQPPEKRP